MKFGPSQIFFFKNYYASDPRETIPRPLFFEKASYQLIASVKSIIVSIYFRIHNVNTQ